MLGTFALGDLGDPAKECLVGRRFQGLVEPVGPFEELLFQPIDVPSWGEGRTPSASGLMNIFARGCAGRRRADARRGRGRRGGQGDGDGSAFDRGRRGKELQAARDEFDACVLVSPMDLLQRDEEFAPKVFRVHVLLTELLRSALQGMVMPLRSLIRATRWTIQL